MADYDIQDEFEIKSIDHDNFDKVSRVDAKGVSGDVEITVDINKEIYPIDISSKYQVRLSNKTTDDWERRYEYIMHGKVYRIKEEKGDIIVFVSFGGLLLRLKGEKELAKITQDSFMYLFMAKVK